MRGQTVYAISLVILIGVLAACSTPGTGESPLAAGPFQFQCGMVNVAFSPGTDGAADMRINNRVWHLQQTRSASGARYEANGDPTTVFWNKGDRALLTLDGIEQSQCMQIAPKDHYIARGNEPGWMIHVSGNNLGLVSDYGNRTILATIQDDEDRTDHRHITARDGNEGLTAKIIKQPCRDDMSGEPFPHQVTLMLGNQRLKGCGGIQTVGTYHVEGITWNLEDLDQGGIIGRSQITLRLETDGRISGNSGCNNYMTRYQREGTRLVIDPRIGGTRMACQDGTLMTQEQRYLDILGRMDRLAVDDTGALILSNGTGETLLFHQK